MHCPSYWRRRVAKTAGEKCELGGTEGLGQGGVGPPMETSPNHKESAYLLYIPTRTKRFYTESATLAILYISLTFASFLVWSLLAKMAEDHVAGLQPLLEHMSTIASPAFKTHYSRKLLTSLFQRFVCSRIMAPEICTICTSCLRCSLFIIL